jgi:hypothetical protein
LNRPWVLVLLALWFGLGLWGLDRLSVHRSLQGQAEVRSVQWTLTTTRMLLPQEELQFGGMDLLRAEVERSSGSRPFTDTSRLVLHTREGQFWLSVAASRRIRDLGRQAAEINAFLRSPAGGTLRIPGDYPAGFFVAAGVFTFVSMFLLAGVLVVGRRR